MSAASDNAMAAAGVRDAFGDIGNYLLQRSVTQPQAAMLNVQAQQAQRQWELQNQAMKGVKLGSAASSGALSMASAFGDTDLSNEPVVPVNGSDAAPMASDTNNDNLSGASSTPSKAAPNTDLTPAPAPKLPPVTPQAPLASLGGSVGGKDVDKSLSTPPKVFPGMTGEEWLAANHLYLDKNNQIQVSDNYPWDAVGTMYRSDAANYDLSKAQGLPAKDYDDIANWQHTISIAKKMVNSPNMRWAQPHPGLPGTWPGKVNQASTPAPAGPTSQAKTIGSNGPDGRVASPGSASSEIASNTQPPSQAGSSTQGASLPGSVSGPTSAPQFNLEPSDVARLDDLQAPAPRNASQPATYSTPFQGLSPDDQTSVLGQMRDNLKGSKFNYSDQELINRYNEEAQKALPPMNPLFMPNLEMTKWTSSGPEFINRDLVNGQGGQDGKPGPFIFAPDGSVQKNPDYITPEDLAGHITDLGNLQAGQKVLNDARTVINTDPGAYGQALSNGAPGTELGQLLQRTKAMFGSSKTYADQRKLEMQNLSGVLSTLSQVHIGRVTEREWDALATSIPKLTDDQPTWNNWLDRVQNTLNYALKAKESVIQPYLGAGAGQQQLPDIDISGSGVGSPAGGGSNYPTVSSPQDYAQLPRGSEFMSNGQLYRKP